MKRYLLGAVLASIAALVAVAPARAQSYVTQKIAICDPNNAANCAAPNSSGQIPTSVAVTVGALAPAGVTTTTVGSSVTTALTFQTALAAAARNGCLITNTSNDVEYIFVGPTASALVTKIIPIAPNGGWFSCNSGVIVIQDNIAITSATLNGATFTVNSQ